MFSSTVTPSGSVVLAGGACCAASTATLNQIEHPAVRIMRAYMTRFAFLVAALLPALLHADEPLKIHRAKKDFALTLDASAWKKDAPVHDSVDPLGSTQPLNQFDFRMLWTPGYLYIHFTC